MVKSIGLAVAALSISACIGHRLNVPEDQNSGSGLSSFAINLPERADLEDAKVFGKDCENIEFSKEKLQELGTEDKCEAAIALLSSYRLKVSVNECQDGVEGTEIDEIAPAKDGKLDASVKKGCRYDVLVGLGKYSKGDDAKNVIYYSNENKYEGILNVAKDAPDQLPPLSIALMATAAAIDLGFPPTKEVITSGDANVSIDVEIGQSAEGEQEGSSDDSSDADNSDSSDGDDSVSNDDSATDQSDNATTPGDDQSSSSTSNSTSSSNSSTGGVPDPN